MTQWILATKTGHGDAGSGASLLAASAMTRLRIFEAGMASARKPKYTVVPARRRRRPASVS